MSAAGRSAAAEAVAIRARARKGLWRRVLAWLGVGSAVRRADARAALWAHGAAGEEATARLLAQLEAQGWRVWHDMRLHNRRFNLDHVLVSPCGTRVVVLDTKAWRRTWSTTVVAGRVHCGPEDRHEQIVKVGGYAAAVSTAIGMGDVVVWPVLVIHGSTVAGGHLETHLPGVGVAYVLDPAWLVPTLSAVPQVRHQLRADVLAARVDKVLRPYVQTS